MAGWVEGLWALGQQLDTWFCTGGALWPLSSPPCPAPPVPPPQPIQAPLPLPKHPLHLSMIGVPDCPRPTLTPAHALRPHQPHSAPTPTAGSPCPCNQPQLPRVPPCPGILSAMPCPGLTLLLHSTLNPCLAEAACTLMLTAALSCHCLHPQGWAGISWVGGGQCPSPQPLPSPMHRAPPWAVSDTLTRGSTEPPQCCCPGTAQCTAWGRAGRSRKWSCSRCKCSPGSRRQVDTWDPASAQGWPSSVPCAQSPAPGQLSGLLSPQCLTLPSPPWQGTEPCGERPCTECPQRVYCPSMLQFACGMEGGTGGSTDGVPISGSPAPPASRPKG